MHDPELQRFSQPGRNFQKVGNYFSRNKEGCLILTSVMSMSKRLLVQSLMVGALCFSASHAFGQNLIKNGGFEEFQPTDQGIEGQPFYVSGTFNNITTNVIGDLTQTPPQPWISGREAVTGDPDTIGSRVEWFSATAPANADHPVQSERADYHPTAAAAGNFAVELHSTQSVSGSPDGGPYDIVYMEQTIQNLVPTQQYVLRFKFADTDLNSVIGGAVDTSNQHARLQISFREGGRFISGLGGFSPINSASADGTSSVTQNATTATFTSLQFNQDENGEGNLWHDGSVMFTATSATQTVRFLDFASSLGNNMSIDAVSLEATPEPATVGAAALLIGAIAVFERKRLRALGLTSFRKFRFSA